MDPDLDQEILGAALFVQLVHRLAHTDAGCDRLLGPDESRHHRIADGLHHRTGLRRNDLEQRPEMRADEIESGQIADPLIERRRSLEIGEQKRQRCDLEALIDAEIIRFVEIAERLVRENPFRGDDRLALAEQIVKRLAGNPDRRQHAVSGLVFQRQPQRTGTHLDGAGRRMHAVECQRGILLLFCRLALDVEEQR